MTERPKGLRVDTEADKNSQAGAIVARTRQAAEFARAKALVEEAERSGSVKADPQPPRECTPEEVARAIEELRKRGYTF